MKILSHNVQADMRIRSEATGREYIVNAVRGGVAEVTRTSGPKVGEKFSYYLINMALSGIVEATGEPCIEFAQPI